MRFRIIVGDYPYNFQDKLTMSDTPRGASANYNTLSNQELINLDIKSLADPDGCVFVLWVPSSLLELGMECMKSYDFKVVQTYIWVKTKNDIFKDLNKDIRKLFRLNTDLKSLLVDSQRLVSNFSKNISENILSFGLGRLMRQTHEIALIGYNNKNIYKHLKNKSQRSVCLAPNEGHSKKPEHLQDSLDLMFDGAKLELFARRDRKGYLCLGNENILSKGEDIRVSIDKLKRLTESDYNLILNEPDAKLKAAKWSTI